MWFMPSRRAHLVGRVFEKAPPSSPGVVVIDDGDQERYAAVSLPQDWALHVVKGCLCYRDKVNQTFDDFPDEAFYGIIADDMVAETPGWDRELVHTAGAVGICGSSQVHFAGHIGAGVIGGELVRALGWLCCPAVRHFYSDDVMELIGTHFGCLTVREDIRIAHHHFAAGLAPHDEVYKARGSSAEDKLAFERWKMSEWPGIRERLAPLYTR